nr:glycosyltransferase domain-containing protein [uncultured Draconibacterium sp.]
MNKKVIYTCLTGHYDHLESPQDINPDWDYICFTDNIKIKNDSIWQFRPLPYTTNDKLRTSRYPKLNPHKVLGEYEISVWIDANLLILNSSFYNVIEHHLSEGHLIAVTKHPVRNCVYNEAEACIREGRDKKHVVNKQIRYLRDQGFPSNYGLFENNIILRQHNSEKVKKQSETWWNLYQRFSKRDQLSLTYSLWSNNLICYFLFPEGKTARNFEGIAYKKHNFSLKKRIKTSIQIRINRLF